jgi:hypothetical protein
MDHPQGGIIIGKPDQFANALRTMRSTGKSKH